MTTYVCEVSGASVTASTDTDMLQIAANDRVVKLTEWSVSFDGVSSSDTPATVQLVRQTTGATGSAATAAKRKDFAGDANADALKTITVGGSDGDVLESYFVTPNGGLFVMQYPADGEVYVPTGEFIAIKVNAPDNVVNVSAWMGWEEL